MFYDRDYIIDLLEYPMSGSQSMLNSRDRAALDEINASYQGEIVVKDKPQDRLYNGDWYSQAGEPTCVPWSIANASLVLGVGHNEDFIEVMRRLLNRANGYTEPKKYGVSQKVLSSTVRSVPRAGLEFVHETLPIATDSLNTSMNLDNMAVKDKPLSTYNYMNRTDELSESVNYALTIKLMLDAGRVPLESVSTESFYWNELRGASHRLVVSGYQVEEDGNFRLQVLDSNYGTYIVPPGHLYRSRLLGSRVFLASASKS